MNILLVEDSATLRHTMERHITQAGHKAIIAEDGEHALHALEHQTIDMVFMDVEMPGLNGFETTKLMREWLDDHWIPILFITGKSDDTSFAEGIEAGGDDYLIKPVSHAILKAKIFAMERIIDMRNELHQLNTELRILSQRDSLTHLYNRRTFNAMAQKEWSRSCRNVTPISLIMIDIDHFKQYNDHYGHPAGDRCLAKVASALEQALLRPADIISRYGGEEFMVLLPDTNLDGAIAVAERLRNTIGRLKIPHETSPNSDFLTSSSGVCCAELTNDFKFDDIVKQTDHLLYKSKARGRNCSHSGSATQYHSVLIADNDRYSIQALKAILGNQYNLITTADSKECIELAQEVLPDVILLDMHNTDVDGIELCKTLKLNPACVDIPVILLANSNGDVSGNHAGTEVADGLIQKPFTEDSLIELLTHVLR